MLRLAWGYCQFASVALEMATLPMASLYWHEDIISLPVDPGKWQGAIGTLELADHS